MSGLREKLIQGTIWNSINQLATVVCNLVLTLVLARLISPEDFGLLGMVTVITGFAGYFSEFGVTASIIRKQNLDEIDCHTAFWGGLGFSAAVYLALYLLAPVVAWFYHNEQLIRITRSVSLVFVFAGFGLVPWALHAKVLNFKLINIIGILSLTISILISLPMAYYGFGVWALVFQQLVLRFAAALLFYVFGGYRPKFEFSLDRFKGLYSYGLHMTATNLVTFLSENADFLLVGKMLGAAQLGLYSMAFRLTRYPIEKFWGLFGKMLFPAFSDMQTDAGRIRRNYMRVTIYGGLLLLPLVLILFLATDLIVQILGNKWLQVSYLIRIFCLYVAVMSFSIADETILSLFKIKLLNIVKSGMCILLLVFGYYAIQFGGIRGMAWAFSILFSLYALLIKCMCLDLIRKLPQHVQEN